MSEDVLASLAAQDDGKDDLWSWTTADGEPLTVVEEPWCCQQCDYEAPTERQVHSHIGAKHIRKLKPVRHGTWQGYKAERRRGLTSCPACKVAWKRYYAARRVSAKAGAVRLRKGVGL